MDATALGKLHIDCPAVAENHDKHTCGLYPPGLRIHTNPPIHLCMFRLGVHTVGTAGSCLEGRNN